MTILSRFMSQMNYCGKRRNNMNQYKINFFKCFWSCYIEIKRAFADKLDNEWLGIILGYALYYLVSIVGFFIFVIIALVKLIVAIKNIKLKIKLQNKVAINALLKSGVIESRCIETSNKLLIL